jgi:hypothetical protein
MKCINRTVTNPVSCQSRTSASRFRCFISLSSLRSSLNDLRPSIQPMSTSWPLASIPFGADLRTTVCNKTPEPLTCSTLHLRLPGTDPMFYPHLCHHRITGTGLYDYYGFICRPSSHRGSRLRLA